jgi:DNA mismatch endonuclease, patch repair protein
VSWNTRRKLGLAAEPNGILLPLSQRDNSRSHYASHRQWNMSRIRSRHTAPERAVEGALRALGYRVGRHESSLPGTPDLVLPRRKLAIFVHGCFWHRHAGCSNCTIPRTNNEFWIKKFAANVARDRQAVRRLRREGWHVMIVWECLVRSSPSWQAILHRRIRRIGPARSRRMSSD